MTEGIARSTVSKVAINFQYTCVSYLDNIFYSNKPNYMDFLFQVFSDHHLNSIYIITVVSACLCCVFMSITFAFVYLCVSVCSYTYTCYYLVSLYVDKTIKNSPCTIYSLGIAFL